MSQENLVTHIPKLYYSTLQLDYLIICNKDACAAKILKLFEFWTAARDEAIEQARYHNAAAHREGREPTYDESSWLYNTIPNLERRLLLEHSRKTVIKALKLLEDKGFIISRHNPEYKWDRTKQYQFQAGVVQEAVYGIKPEDLAAYYTDSDPVRRETLDFMHRVNLPYASCKNDPMHRVDLHDQSGKNDPIDRADLHDDPKSLTKNHSNSQEENTPLSPPGESVSEPPPQVVTVEVMEPEPTQQTSNEGMTDNQTTSQVETVKAKDPGLDHVPPAATNASQKSESIVRARSQLPAYRLSWERDGIREEFLSWMCLRVMSGWSPYKQKTPTPHDAKNWVRNREKEGCQDLVENRYDQMLSEQANPVVASIFSSHNLVKSAEIQNVIQQSYELSKSKSGFFS